MVRVFVELGIEKVRLTGGEPLLRKGLLKLVYELRRLRTPVETASGRRPLDLALTTNGHLLAELAQPLRDAGLNRVTVSMDAVVPDTFARITRVPGLRPCGRRGSRRQAGRLRPNQGRLRAAARFQRRPNRSLREVFPRGRRYRPVHRIHAA
jgi:hypothetical protein